jgi:hypothetical protein
MKGAGQAVFSLQKFVMMYALSGSLTMGSGAMLDAGCWMLTKLGLDGFLDGWICGMGGVNRLRPASVFAQLRRDKSARQVRGGGVRGGGPGTGLGELFADSSPFRRAGKPGSPAGKDARRHGDLSELIRPNPTKKLETGG